MKVTHYESFTSLGSGRPHASESQTGGITYAALQVNRVDD